MDRTTVIVSVRKDAAIRALKVLWEAGLISLDQMREGIRRERGY